MDEKELEKELEKDLQEDLPQDPELTSLPELTDEDLKASEVSEDPEKEDPKKETEDSKDPKVAELEMIILGQEEEIKELSSKNSELENALKARIDADLASLSPEDKALVEELGEGDPLKMMQAFSKLSKSGKLGQNLHPALTQRAGQNVLDKPLTPDQAAKAVIDAALGM